MTHEVRQSQVPTLILNETDATDVRVSQVPADILLQRTAVSVRASQVPVMILLNEISSFTVRYVSVN